MVFVLTVTTEAASADVVDVLIVTVALARLSNDANAVCNSGINVSRTDKTEGKTSFGFALTHELRPMAGRSVGSMGTKGGTSLTTTEV